MYQLIFSKKFLNQPRNLPDKEQDKILHKISELTANPRTVSLQLLGTKPPIYRFRIGEYRVFCELDESAKIVHITDVLRRTTQTYR